MQHSEQDIFHRSRLLMGDQMMELLGEQRAIIFGVGGVGSWCAESLIRSGLRHLTIVDSDRVCISNINRQLMATTATIGRVKVDALRQRLLEINPHAHITALQDIYNSNTAESFELESYDIIVDAIDSLAEKAQLILHATSTNAIFVSSMGAALKNDPTRIQSAEFRKAHGCPLARALRKKFKNQHRYPSRNFSVVFSDEVLPNLGAEAIDGYEPSIDPNSNPTEGRSDLAQHSWNARKAQINGTMPHITAIFGFTLAGIVVNKIYEKNIANNEKS